jgi:hypothetical protein
MYPIIEMTIILKEPKRYIQDVQNAIENWFYIEKAPGNLEIHYNTPERRRVFLRPADAGEYATLHNDPEVKAIFSGGSVIPTVPIPNIITWKGW